MESWIKLTSEEQLNELSDLSAKSGVAGVVVFKHSTRCSISAMALSRLERSWNFPPATLPLYFLDLLAHRNISNKIAEVFRVTHESPQLLFIRKGACVYHASHGDVSVAALQEFLDGDSQR